MSKEIDYLENWAVLNEHVKSLTEKTVFNLLKREYKNGKRPQFLLRLYGRYNTLRTAREREEIMQGNWKV